MQQCRESWHVAVMCADCRLQCVFCWLQPSLTDDTARSSHRKRHLDETVEDVACGRVTHAITYCPSNKFLSSSRGSLMSAVGRSVGDDQREQPTNSGHRFSRRRQTCWRTARTWHLSVISGRMTESNWNFRDFPLLYTIVGHLSVPAFQSTLQKAAQFNTDRQILRWRRAPPHRCMVHETLINIVEL